MACQPAKDAPAERANIAKEEIRIEWFDGDPEAAFAEAKRLNRPLFLYWGAVWCPPCNHIKATVFNKPEFIRKTQNFIPVYIDGDAPGAQRWGEYFAASGYPTLIVFSADGQELTRLSSGIDGQHYLGALDEALRQAPPVSAQLPRALDDPESLEPSAWTQLALYSWGQDQGRVLGSRALPDTLLHLARVCQPGEFLSCQRLRLLASIENKDGLAVQDWPMSVEEFRALLNHPESRRLNLYDLAYEGASLIAHWAKPGSPRFQELSSDFQRAMQGLYEDASLSTKSRLLSSRALIDLHHLQAQAPSPELQTLIRQRAAWANEAAASPYERQSLIYQAAWYLHEVDLSEEALRMLEAELERSLAPYYYMSYLATICAELDRHEDAVAWAQKAWTQSQGSATRIQWGVQLAQRQMKSAPQDQESIDATIQAIVADFQRQGDVVHQRNRLRLQKLLTSIENWAAGHAERSAQAQQWRQQIETLCPERTPCLATT